MIASLNRFLATPNASSAVGNCCATLPPTSCPNANAPLPAIPAVVAIAPPTAPPTSSAVGNCATALSPIAPTPAPTPLATAPPAVVPKPNNASAPCCANVGSSVSAPDSASTNSGSLNRGCSGSGSLGGTYRVVISGCGVLAGLLAGGGLPPPLPPPPPLLPLPHFKILKLNN